MHKSAVLLQELERVCGRPESSRNFSRAQTASPHCDAGNGQRAQHGPGLQPSVLHGRDPFLALPLEMVLNPQLRRGPCDTT